MWGVGAAGLWMGRAAGAFGGADGLGRGRSAQKMAAHFFHVGLRFISTGDCRRMPSSHNQTAREKALGILRAYRWFNRCDAISIQAAPVDTN